jgi:uncharacterized membrane protein
MEAYFHTIAGYIALGVEALAALVIAIGAVEAVIGLFRMKADPRRPLHPRKAIWVRFAVWLLLALEFELASDVVRSIIAPTWNDIGELAAIAVIRTFLNYFLEKDINRYSEEESAAEAERPEQK